MHNKNLSVFMQTIGYDFKDISLLEVALTHSSYANEQKKGNCCDNERMEFLGDAVLELSSSDYIYKNHSEMAEGKMTRLRASIVCEPTLALCARAIKLDTFIRLGKGEELTGGRSRDSIVSDACEAVIGAIYLDVSETIFVIVESADVSFGYDVLLVAASLDVGSNLAKARVV